MSHNCKTGVAADAFGEYLQTMMKLDTLEKMTQVLDDQLADSQRAMKEINVLFSTLPNTQNGPANNLQREDIAKFLEANTERKLPDMLATSMDVDLENIIGTMKVYAEDLKKKLESTPAQSQDKPAAIKQIESLNLQPYAISLDQLGKRIASIKIVKKAGDEDRTELELKLSQLCQDVNLFTQMVQAKSTLSEGDKKWSMTTPDNKTFTYDDTVTQLLAGINEVTYLIQNKK